MHSSTHITTIPLRCEACGQQTHKTLESITQNGGFLCACGALTELDVKEFTKELDKSESHIKDYGRDG